MVYIRTTWWKRFFHTVNSCRFFTLPVIVLSVVSLLNVYVANAGGGIEKDPIVSRLSGSTTVYYPAPNDNVVYSKPLANNEYAESSYTPQGDQPPAIKNIVTLSIKEESTKFISVDFTADIKVRIDYGHTSAYGNVKEVNLVVNYSRVQGAKFNPKSYFHFDNAEYVKVTIMQGQMNISPAMSGNLDLREILLLENEIRVTEFFNLVSNVAPVNLQTDNTKTTEDELAITWDPWLPQQGVTHTQLEWTWVETEMESYYHVAGVLNTDLLFRNNSTRIDLPANFTEYTIPKLYDADPDPNNPNRGGKVYYRIRAVNIAENGTRTDGPWSNRMEYFFLGHESTLNWQVTTSYAEEGKRNTVIEYYDGSLRPRQTVTKDNENKTLLTAETFYDGQGRPAIQILPVPGINGANNVIRYQANLNLFNTQLPDQNPADFFDLKPLNELQPLNGGDGSSNNPGPGADYYYSTKNPDRNTGNNKFIPDAGGYPYTQTQYMPDGTGRIMRQSGVGTEHKMGSGKETRYYYGTPAQEELDGLFGTEVGNETHYFKNMVKDANGQLSVSYVDMHGRTIATALAGDAPGNLDALNTTNNVMYQNQTSQYQEINRDLLDANTNIVKENAIEAINTIVVTSPQLHNFKYTLDPGKIQLASCTTGVQFCYDCLYDLEISITDESGDTDPFIWKFSNVSLTPDDDCGTATPDLSLVSYPDNTAAPTISGTDISFSKFLDPGSYSIRKTLRISETSLQQYLERYRLELEEAGSACESKEQLTQSIFLDLQSQTSCNNPPTQAQACATCKEKLGADVAAFRSNYLTSLGKDPLVVQSQQLETEISAAYQTAYNNCELLCNTTSTRSLEIIREMMLQDMKPYSGQYAREVGTGTSMYNKYDIFSTQSSNPPFFQHPKNEDGSDGTYLDAFGNPDQTIYSIDADLGDVTKEKFHDLFNDSWANSLLYHHPEFQKLKYAEDNLGPSYDWIDKFMSVSSYADASNSTNNYILTSNNSATNPSPYNDPFYIFAPASYREAMAGKITSFVTVDGTTFSMWQMAYAQIKCSNVTDPEQRKNCALSVPALPPYNLSPAENDKLWQTFQAMYANERRKHVNSFIAANVPAVENADLIAQNYMLHFPETDEQIAQQGNQTGGVQNPEPWDWWPTTPYAPPANVNLDPAANNLAAYTNRCESYIQLWKTALRPCIEARYPNDQDDALVETILNEITQGMKQVCINGSDEANPNGSSNVPDSYTGGGPRSFEEVIDNVFANPNYGITKSALCNPFVIEWPKPYGKGPKLLPEFTTAVDKCACDKFSAILTAAGNPSNLNDLNTYLQQQYGETLTQELYDAMVQNCGLLGSTICETVNAQGQCIDRHCFDVGNDFTLAYPQPMPRFLKCGDVYNRCVTCSQLSGLTAEFKNYFDAPHDAAPVFNSSNPTDDDIAGNVLFAKFLNYRTGFQYNWMEYAQKLYDASPSCDLANYANNTAANQNVTCGEETDIITEKDPCQSVHDQAVAMANAIWEEKIRRLMHDFEANYRATCLAVQSTEIFTVDYKNKEYHYTLYYYDMAGNLVKTVPPAGVKPDFRKVYTDQVEIDKAAGILNTRPHTLVTQYRYNSLNQVVTQNSPDANTSEFWYDKLGRLVVSQNAQQKSDGKYSYTIYDGFGRITEVGQKPQSTQMTQEISQNLLDVNALKNWLDGPGVREQVTYTGYDNPYGLPPNGTYYGAGLDQKNLRNRVSYTYTRNFENDQVNPDDPPFYTGTFYTYDIHGNVEMMLQDYSGVTEMKNTGNTQKRIVYDYDLISGKVNMVSYQPDFYSSALGEWVINQDKFFHKYKYDAQNRLKEVYTSRDKIVWERDAAYQYYKHGPLSRTEYGQLRTQGLDYAYTIQGWLKGVNSTAISATSANCPEGTVLGSVLNVTGRSDYGKPAVYSATQEINFEPDFVSDDNDEFETLLDANATVCTPGQANQNIPYTSGDMGRDGDPTDNINDKVARDAYGFALNYFNNDYTAIGTGIQSFATGLHNLPQWKNSNGVADGVVTGAGLFNGNIASMLVSIPKLGIATEGNSGTNPILYGYRYDQLNRIVGMNAYKNDPDNTQPNVFSPEVMDDYKERISYDPNGNILTYRRNGTTAAPKAGTGNGGKDMDELTYKYLYIKPDNTKGEYIPGVTVLDPSWKRTNQLASVADEVDAINGGTGADNYKIDIDGQDAFNYEYDKIGNLVKDGKENGREGITNISWTVYGKISSITKVKDGATTTIEYTYDASGNRITKKVSYPPEQGTGKIKIKNTFYVRDASGNTMSVYEMEKVDNLYDAFKQTEIHLYGNSRIGMVTECSKPPVPVAASEFAAGFGTAFTRTLTRNEKIFELSNHLGNVLVTITDKKKAVDSDGDGDIDYYEADVISANDYYPGGMQMPGRTIGSSTYRFGFQNQEIDKELWGGAVAFEYRVEDPRLNRFFSVDPLADDYPHNSPYAFAENRLIDGVELEGLEWQSVKDKDGKTIDYTWVGYNSDGTPKACSEPGGQVFKEIWALDGPRRFSFWFSSDAKSRSGKIEIYSLDQSSISRGWYSENTPFYDYLVHIRSQSAGRYGTGYRVTAQVGNNFTYSKEFDLDGYNPNMGGGYSGDQAFSKIRGTLFPAPKTSIDSDGLGPVDFLLGLGELKLAGASRKIIGLAQTTGTKGHAFTSKLIAWRYALDPRVEKVTLDLGYKRLLGSGPFKWGPRPDVGVLFKNKKVKVFEVMSKTDIEERLYNRNFNFMQLHRIPAQNPIILKPFSLKALYK